MWFASAIYGEAHMTAGDTTTTFRGDDGDKGEDDNGDDNQDDDGEKDCEGEDPIAYSGNYPSSKFREYDLRTRNLFHFLFYIYFTYS